MSKMQIDLNGWLGQQGKCGGGIFRPKKLGFFILSFNVTMEDFIIVREKRFTDLGEI